MLSFDGATKRITLSPGTVTLSVIDLWSRWIDWFAISDNSKFGEAMRQVGGDIPSIPIYAFLLDGWKIVPQAANHILTITDGVLAVDGGGDPFVDPNGAWSIRINLQTPGIAIGYATGEGSGPTAATIAQQVRAELAAELAKLDATISSRSTGTVPADVRYVNGVAIKGSGQLGNEWGPV